MRSWLRYLVTLGVVTGLVMAGAGWADAQGILGSKHNLTNTANAVNVSGASTTEVCVFCHTPHGADAAVKAPLWNRQVSATSAYTLYDSNHSSTIDANVAPSELGVSLACLSCHDGQIAFDALRNMPGSGNTAINGTWTPANKLMPAGVTNLGQELRDDHPIAITYSEARSPSSASASETAGFTNAITSGSRQWVTRLVNVNGTSTNIMLPLYADSTGVWRVQCATCHDPHRAGATGQELFLRSTNNQFSKLCRTCHLKDVDS